LFGVILPEAKTMSEVALESLIEDGIASDGVHVIDILIKHEGKGKSVEVFIDSVEGVTAETCSHVSRQVAEALRSAGVAQSRLTVSSPGVSRPLRFPWQYRKHVGRALQLNVRFGHEVREISGILETVQEDSIVVSTGGESATVGFDAIVQARVKTPW
jgi:ribosome maturation factor RimP